MTFPELISWTDRPEEGIKYYSGKATYKKAFDLRLKADENKKALPTEKLRCKALKDCFVLAMQLSKVFWLKFSRISRNLSFF